MGKEEKRQAEIFQWVFWGEILLVFQHGGKELVAAILQGFLS